MSVVPQSDDGSVTEDSIFGVWGRVSLEAGEKFGKTLSIVDLSKGYMEDAGFEGVVEHRFKLPIGGWSSDPKLKDIGRWNQLHWEEGIEGWCMALLTRILGVSPRALHRFVCFRGSSPHITNFRTFWDAPCSGPSKRLRFISPR